jgi:hypothetical protein
VESSDPIKSLPATPMASGPRHIGQESERPADGEFVDELEALDVHRLQVEVAVLRARLYAAESLAKERSERIEDLRTVIGMIPSDRLKGDPAPLGLADRAADAGMSRADQPLELEPIRRQADEHSAGNSAEGALAAIWQVGPTVAQADGPAFQESDDSSAAAPHTPEAAEFIAAQPVGSSARRRRWWRGKR